MNEIRIPNVALSWIANIIFASLEAERHSGQGKVDRRKEGSSTLHISSSYSN
jgi:hypothetical protein